MWNVVKECDSLLLLKCLAETVWDISRVVTRSSYVCDSLVPCTELSITEIEMKLRKTGTL